LRFAYPAQSELTDEPQTLREVLARPDAAQWKQSMDEEIQALLSMGVYEIVPSPPNVHALDCRWVYKIKRDSVGNIDKYKSRVVVKGFQQKAGVDYDEIFAPVSRHATVRVILSMAAVYELDVHQMDVKTAFLHGELTEVAYMRLPPGYQDDGRVCLLKKALYGLKQAARAWYLKLKGTLLKFGYKVATADPSLYLRGNGNGMVVLLVYVDDILLMGSTDNVLTAKGELMDAYSSHDLGEVSYFLGFEIVRDRSAKTVWIGQTKLIRDTLRRYALDNSNPTVLPMDAGLKLRSSQNDEECVTDQPYREVVGSLLYLASCTRPDIAFESVCCHVSCLNRRKNIGQLLNVSCGT
jgi:hypothetical protein